MAHTVKCRKKGCRGRTTESRRSPWCDKCRWLAWKEKNPLRYSFGNLRRRAKARGKEFTLTFGEYVGFAITTGYASLKGKTQHSLSIHRKDNDQGYHSWNIAAVTLSQNSRMLHSNMPGWMKEEMRRVMAGELVMTAEGLREASSLPASARTHTAKAA